VCGIAGAVGTGESVLSADVLERLAGLLAHRGPDDAGYLSWSPGADAKVARSPDELPPGRVQFVHRRLSILDLTRAGAQPMSTPDGRFHIVFNGEIYNYVELRAELEALGRTFRSRCDTEVLLAACAHWGREALGRLVGMFAFALLDIREHKLLLARDFFGIKPLYYANLPGGVAFASEITTMPTIPGVSRRVAAGPLHDYLRYGMTDHRDETLFCDIRRLPPAHYMEIDLDNPHGACPREYWRIDPGGHAELSFDEAAAELRRLFLRSVDLHLRSDVTVGAALSGGIDSASIVAAIRELRGPGQDIHAISYIAPSKRLNEEKWVDLVGDAAGANVHKTRPGPDDLAADLPKLIAVQGEPFASTSIFAQFRVFRLAAERSVTVMLDGQGADELLGGYRPYLAARLASLIRRGQFGRAFAFLRSASRFEDTGAGDLLARTAGLMLPRFLGAIGRKLVGREPTPLWLDERWFAGRGVCPVPDGPVRGRRVLADRMLHSVRTAPLPMLLRYEDRNSMAFSIESRTPFLTPDLAQFVFSLPEEYVISPTGESKSVFRAAMRGLVPDAILDRRDKIGFATPEQDWLKRLRPWVERALGPDAVARVPALKGRVVRRLWTEVLAGRRYFDPTVWRWINAVHWAREMDVSFDA